MTDADKAKMQQFLAAMNITMYDIQADGTVDVQENVYIFNDHLVNGRLPIKFGKVTGVFCTSDCDIISLEGAPHTVTKTFRCRQAKKLVSLEGAPSIVGGDVIVTGCPHITSLTGIADIFKSIAGIFSCTWSNITTGGIGLVCIDKLTKMHTYDPSLPEQFDIISKYLRKPDELFDCQAELMDHGYDDNAVL